jgi:predicted nucleic acid-binding protein
MGQIMAEITLCDTDILIDAGLNDQRAVQVLLDSENTSALAICTITEMEMIVGCRNKAELKKVEQFLERFTIIKLDAAICDTAVSLLKTYRASHGLKMPDALIAATAIAIAIAYQIPLITKNQRDFRFIAGLALPAYP